MLGSGCLCVVVNLLRVFSVFVLNWRGVAPWETMDLSWFLGARQDCGALHAWSTGARSSEADERNTSIFQDQGRGQALVDFMWVVLLDDGNGTAIVNTSRAEWTRDLGGIGGMVL